MTPKFEWKKWSQMSDREKLTTLIGIAIATAGIIVLLLIG